ncbi:hypothetical protein JY97_15135 [Alkalispirochaeta odontotermitis]|nr:hypothetical protein JY97_15135 [Alkalispirochaeta odontotermitis]CAD7848695.1 MAG: hypothetical protein [Olavius algarvensis Delta 4 endosymbiont]
MHKSIEKILLLVPPAISSKIVRDVNPLPPIGLGYLASVIREEGLQVNICDCLLQGWNQEEEISKNLIKVGLSDYQIAKVLMEYDPDIVGVSCQFSRQNQIYHRLFKLIKNTNRDIITIAGGSHVTVCPEEILKDENCDYIILGEGEVSIRQFIHAVTKRYKFNEIDGFGWKENGVVKINKKQSWIKDLDTISWPAYDLIGLEKYFGIERSHGKRKKERFCPIITSRGCPANCTFCSAKKVWGKKFRVRSIENVINEMKYLKKEFGIEEILFEDDNVTANPKRAKQLFERMIDEDLGFVWDTPNGVGVWSIDQSILNLMKASGCLKVNFPVESGSQRVLTEIIRKPIQLKKVEALIGHCRNIGLPYGMFLVIGMPGETVNDIWESFKFSAKCKCYNPHISVATPYPGTELFEGCIENNYFAKVFEFDDLFIRSYMIRTENWDENDLRKILVKGRLYLIIKALFEDPVFIIKKLYEKVKILKLFCKT